MVLARGGSQTEAASRADVHKSTVGRWVKEESFLALISDLRQTSDEDAASLLDLVPKALELLNNALDGKISISAAQQRVALDVIKAAASIEGRDAASSELEQRLIQLDQADIGSD